MGRSQKNRVGVHGTTGDARVGEAGVPGCVCVTAEIPGLQVEGFLFVRSYH